MEPLQSCGVLEGAVIRLEPMTLEHLDGLAAVGLDEELWRWTWNRVTSVDEMRAYVAAALRDRDHGKSAPLVTVERATGQVIGCTRFMNIELAHGRVEIGSTWLARPWQRTAANTEAKLLMLSQAFEVWDCLRVELKTDALNERSRQAILRLGAREEGTLRRHMKTWSGRMRDTVYYSILNDEWAEVRERLKSRLARHVQIMETS